MILTGDIKVPKIQYGSDGKYSVTLSKDIVEAKGWKAGGKVEFAIVDQKEVFAHPGDIVIRYTPPVK